ncbi:uncharacterized protein B0P05DRAFT_542201 [Gilbertella persicaria]|uniref:uncharacterized protein n=1 Tax=Gilbertella persicaria TaxID=101096 RepID=UPI00221F38A9|nr:uncharacterized protein B0P05DRAFT_542201 [Gilbertella persicaria]KAI8079063.1 hypothetical protein B0P05DRAFT_542201 [Gilbertella persicaria]
MPSEKFRIATNGQSLRNPNNAFFGMTLSANLTVDESDVSAHNDRRSAHNALERQRREHLNIKFQQLAHALPSLQSVRRPSKTMIVAKSLEFVSSSLKRESNYTSEIQRLRAENEKLRKQAQASSAVLKKQISLDQDNEKTDAKSETITLPAKEEEKASLKRKASEADLQLSPPPTPEAMRGSNNKKSPAPVIIATPQKKKKMVKQTKPLQSQLHTLKSSPINEVENLATSASMVAPLIESPWSPVDDHFRPMNAYPITSTADNTSSTYFNISTSPYTTSSTTPANNNDLIFMTPNSSVDLYQHQSIQAQNMMHSMLFAPYNLASEPTADFTYAFSHQRQTSHPNDFYFS